MLGQQSRIEIFASVTYRVDNQADCSKARQVRLSQKNGVSGKFNRKTIDLLETILAKQLFPGSPDRQQHHGGAIIRRCCNLLSCARYLLGNHFIIMTY